MNTFIQLKYEIVIGIDTNETFTSTFGNIARFVSNDN